MHVPDDELVVPVSPSYNDTLPNICFNGFCNNFFMINHLLSSIFHGRLRKCEKPEKIGEIKFFKQLNFYRFCGIVKQFEKEPLTIQSVRICGISIEHSLQLALAFFEVA
ncbi:MAG: hypothetical protein FWG34_13725 [Oscillospiraceae bacterium]|nr:hypothetical protein [Oscillospiraceae bacterium]